MKKRIIIMGGGFAGLQLAKKLSGSKHFEIIIVDRNNYHFFPPLLYQVSTGIYRTIQHQFIPIGKCFNAGKISGFIWGELLNVDPESNTIKTSNGSLKYDYLVLAMGTESNFFGNEKCNEICFTDEDRRRGPAYTQSCSFAPGRSSTFNFIR